MNTKIEDLMVTQVITGRPHQTVGHAQDIMRKHGIHAIPIVGPEGEPVGILTASDILEDHKDATPISQVMTRHVYTVPQYSDVHIAARVMRNKHTHHVVVTHEQKVVGMVSSFDLLQLVEDHRFVMKNPPSDNKKQGQRGQRETDTPNAD